MGRYEVRRPRALVIDDEAIVRDLMCELLVHLGFETDDAASGAEGLTVFEQRTYDLVVTDLMMPGLTGWQLAEEIRGRKSAVSIIMASGSLSNLDHVRARELNVTILPKPCSLEELRRVVAPVLATVGGGPRVGLAEEAHEGRPRVDETSAAPALPITVRDPHAVLSPLRLAVTQLVDAVEAVAAEHEGAHARWTELSGEHQDLRTAYDELVGDHRATLETVAQLRADLQKALNALGEVRDQYEGIRREREMIAEELQRIIAHLRR